MAVMVLAVDLGVVILANVAGWSATRAADPMGERCPKPTTMTGQQSDSFAQQQRGQADYMKGWTARSGHRTPKIRFSVTQAIWLTIPREDEGIPKKTKAQDDAEHGRNRAAEQVGSRAARERARSKSSTGGRTISTLRPCRSISQIISRRKKLSLQPAVPGNCRSRSRQHSKSGRPIWPDGIICR